MLRQFAFLVVVAVSAPAQDGGIVRGTVTNSATRAGLAGVEVTLWTQQAIRYNATSDERGDWQISGMKPGRYSSRFEKSGFIEPPRANPFDGSSVVVGAGGAPIRLDAELSPLATLRGRVLNPDGTPAPDIEVRSVVFASVKTGADGEFELTGVRPGSYTLRAMPKTAPPKSSDDRRTEIVPTYFPSTIDSAEAAKIVVRGGEDLSGFEIRLQASPVYRVRGVVLDDAGQPLANANVQLLSRNRGHVLAGSMSMGGPVNTRYFLGSDSLEAEEAATLTRADGSFEFPSVHPGDWLLRAETDPKRDSAQTLVIMRSNPQDAAVTDHDLVDLQIRFSGR